MTALASLEFGMRNPQNPTGEGWNQNCQSFARQCYGFPPIGDAMTVLHNTHIVSTDANAAPANAAHWFGGNSVSGTHVMVGLGGANVISTSSPDPYDGYDGVGVSRVERYTHLPYVGWSTSQAGYGIDVGGDWPWIAWQKYLVQFGYTGPADGWPQINTYRAQQRAAHTVGYNGPIDGWPGYGTNTNFLKLVA